MRRVDGWLNVDLVDGDLDCDLASGDLPWRDSSFEAVVSQHFVEHLELETQCLPLLVDLLRVLEPRGELWLSCPDIGKICRAYADGELESLLEKRLKRWPTYSLGDKPVSHLVNDLFHQYGEHKNLFDYDLLRWALTRAGFAEVAEVSEEELLDRFPGFPPRNDGEHTLYVLAQKPG